MEAYAKAGADVLFIESPESEAEMARIGKAFRSAAGRQHGAGRRTPVLTPAGATGVGLPHALFPINGLWLRRWR